MDSDAVTTLTRRIGIVVAAAWTLAILVLCTIPGNQLPQVGVLSADKIGHFAMFTAFGWLWMHALRLKVRVRFGLVLAAGLAYAVLTEVYQGVLPFGREPDMWDAVANSVGLLVGIGVWRLFTQKRNTAADAGR